MQSLNRTHVLGDVVSCLWGLNLMPVLLLGAAYTGLLTWELGDCIEIVPQFE